MNGNGAHEQINTLIGLNELLQSTPPVSTSAAGHIYPQPEKETAGSFLEDTFRFATSLGVDTGELDWRKLPLYLIGLGMTVGGGGKKGGGGFGLLKKPLNRTQYHYLPKDWQSNVAARTKQAESSLSWLGKWFEDPKTMKRVEKLRESYDKLFLPGIPFAPRPPRASKGIHKLTRTRARGMIDEPGISGFKAMDAGTMGEYRSGAGIRDIFLSDKWLKSPSGKHKLRSGKFAIFPGTVVHEGAHDLFFGRLPPEIKGTIQANMDKLNSASTRNILSRLTQDQRDYLKNPDELYPVIMGLRREIGARPGKTISKKGFKTLLRGEMKNTMNYTWLSYVYKDETLRNLLNTVPALTAISLAGIEQEE